MATTKKDLREYPEDELIRAFQNNEHLMQVFTSCLNSKNPQLIYITANELYEYTPLQTLLLTEYFFDMSENSLTYRLQHKHLS